MKYEKFLVWQRNRRLRRKAKGICVDCMMRPSGDNNVVCAECRRQRRDREFTRTLRMSRQDCKHLEAA